MKETYTRKEMLHCGVEKEDLNAAKKEEPQCRCFPWVRFWCASFYYCSNFCV
jgi:hypothetical protein